MDRFCDVPSSNLAAWKIVKQIVWHNIFGHMQKFDFEYVFLYTFLYILGHPLISTVEPIKNHCKLQISGKKLFEAEVFIRSRLWDYLFQQHI